MTPLMSKKDFAGLGAPDLVYVREVTAREALGSTAVTTAEGLEITPDQTLFAVHGADGQRLALMIDRDTAFATAVAHELAPVSVH